MEDYMKEKKNNITFFVCIFSICVCVTVFGQAIAIDGSSGGRIFDGIGAVSGGGATSVFLMSYPEPYRSQILDYLFKPQCGASISAFFCEIGGDCNSTQGSEPSHMHTAIDENYQRGYEWWLIREAKKRNPDITLDGVAWGAPGWVGNGNFWSQDMQDYYVKWINGLKTHYGHDLDAIGCRNESGSNYDWAIQFRQTLDNNGLSHVKLHAFDNWQDDKYDFVNQFETNTALRDAIDIISAHTTWVSEWSERKMSVPDMAKNTGKPIWDTEEHAYFSGFDCETAIVNACNSNYIDNRVTKVIFWHLISAYYPLEPYYNVTMGTASEPWSGHYDINPALWGYAHYGQFVKTGWRYVDTACGRLPGGGTYVTLKSPDNADFSTIIETKGISVNQTVAFAISGGLPTTKTLCVWQSNSSAQFVRQADIGPSTGTFSLTIEGNSIYSISTTTGQQKGSYSIPESKAFPIPYYENYDHYIDPAKWGYLPYFHADICGVFEIATRPDGTGKCLRQVLDTKAISWAPEWAPYTIIGDQNWTDYETSVDVSFDDGGWASIMGRVNNVGSGYGCYPSAYYLRLSANGGWGFYYTSWSADAGNQLVSGNVGLSGTWHNLKLRFYGSIITGFINGSQVFTISNSSASRGMVGLGTGDVGNVRNTALFDNLIINTVGGSVPPLTVFGQDGTPPYGDSTITPSPTSPPENPGDVNGSGTVDIVDALLVARYYVGLDPSGFDLLHADTNCDGAIDIIDALLIAQFYVGLITGFC
jgi:galactosylceramidase